MAAGYVDDHRLILYRDGAAARDITAFCGDLTAKDDLDALSVEVTFHIFKSVWDKYTPALNLAPGDKIRIVNHGNTVFSGVIVTVTLDGTVTAYDRGWYLNKSEIILQVNNLAADQVIRQASADRVGRKRQISEIWGCDEVRSGVVLDFNSPAFGISGRHRVTSVTHQYGGAGHVMSLEISALDEPRAAAAGKSSAAAVRAASADSVKVWGLPDLGGGASGGTTVKALFTAYYPAANALEGGFLDAQGNKLDPSKKTCAAPPSVAFGTKVTVQGTGTSLDGVTYTVNDRGGAIQIEGGVYHFDLLMRTNAECNSWGRKTGTAILGGSAGGGSASSFVDTALGEVGYRESSGNRTKYGAEMGCDGVAWCVIFVCWCAKHSSAPIPTTYTAVSEMRSYFEKRGKFKTVASGYKPKAGDLMIIGSSHIGIVLSGGASSCETIEGNYSDGVGRVKRSYSEITGFCCPW